MIFLASVALPVSASAAEIIVYADAYYSGGSRNYMNDVSNLDYESFNDRISSIRVVSGIWTVCSDANYSGRCETVSGDVSNLASTGLNDRISSIRLESGQGSYDGGYGRNYEGIVLYSDRNYRGREARIDYDAATLGEFNFNDSAASARVRDGVWELCEDANFRGHCETISSDAPDLGRLHNQVSSVRLISRDHEDRDGWWDSSRDDRWDNWDDDEQYRAVVYEHVDYRGGRREFNGAVPSFAQLGFNDRISSMRLEGRWQVCEHINFGGECEVYRFDEANLAQTGWNDRISSMRPLGQHQGQGATRIGALVLFEDGNFRGDRQRLRDDEPDLRNIGFNNIASSLRVRRSQWEICTERNYQGRCVIVEDHDTRLGDTGLNDQISSARRVDVVGGSPGGYRGITIYEHTNYQGDDFSAVQDVPNLSAHGFNDRLSSFRIDDGTWELCEHSNYQGRCWTADRDDPNVVPNGFNDRISSLRRLDQYGGGYNGGYNDGGYYNDDDGYANNGTIQVFEHTNYDGRSRTFSSDVSNFGQVGWNDEVSSFRISGPGRWEICDDAYYNGRCQIFTTDEPNLVQLNWNDRISSVRYLP